MKKKLLYGLTAVAASGILVGCSDSFSPGSDQQGRIFPSVGLNTEVVTSVKTPKTAGSRAAQAVTPSQLALDLTSADGNVKVHWDSADLFPAGEDWPVGAYTMEASYGNIDEEGINKPYYYGKTEFDVKENQTTPVSITAQLANSMVTVTYTDNFKRFFKSYSATLLTSKSGSVAYPAEATDACYVKPGAVTLSLDVVKQNGVKATLTPRSFTAEARHHYRLQVDVNGQSGDGQLILKFDEMLAEEDVVIDLSDELINAPAPTLTPKGFTNGQEISYIAGSAPTDPLKLTLIAHGGISSLVMKTVSTSLIEQGWPAEVDLAAGDASAAAALSSLGLTTAGLTHNPEKLAVVDLTKVLNHIEYIDGITNTSVLTFQARDKYGKESEELSLKLSLKVLEMAILQPEAIYEGEQEITFMMTFNGTTTENIRIQTRGANGQWADTEATITPSGNAYKVVAKVAETGDVHVSALLAGKRSNELIVERAASPFAIQANGIDVFARSASVTLIDNTVSRSGRRVRAAASDAAGAELQVSIDGKSYTKATATLSGTTWKVTNLTPGTKYYVRAKIGVVPTKPVVFTTETALQLPNSDFETAPTILRKKDNWEEYDFGVWGTNNPMTTMKSVSDGTWFTDYAYDRISGTKPTDDAHSGSAVRISTQGWGQGNTAISGVSGVCKHIDAGLLHLGSSRSARPSAYGDRPGPLTTDDLNCGMEFASRPSSLSLWYKYEAKNSADYGTAKVVVYDASGNVIAEGTANLTAAASYTQKTIPLTYSAGAAKAAKIYVCFMSTHSSDFLVKDSAYLDGPGNANLSRGEYSGSRLYLDDLSLNY